jgi:hypothetical protein
MVIPRRKYLRLPSISATLPKGNRNIAYGRRYAVGTQPSIVAGTPNDTAMRGRAICTPDDMKGAAKEARQTAKRIVVRVRLESGAVGMSMENSGMYLCWHSRKRMAE